MCRTPEIQDKIDAGDAVDSYSSEISAEFGRRGNKVEDVDVVTTALAAYEWNLMPYFFQKFSEPDSFVKAS